MFIKNKCNKKFNDTNIHKRQSKTQKTDTLNESKANAQKKKKRKRKGRHMKNTTHEKHIKKKEENLNKTNQNEK